MDLKYHPKDDHSSRYWIFHEWIQANGQLTEQNVFDYFAESIFYDKMCNNQVLRMQTMHTGMPIDNEAEKLRRMTGLEFAVVIARPPSLFVIHKRERMSPDEVRPLAAYFIMNNGVYQSPDLYTVLSSRLLTTVNCLQSSLETLRAHRPDFAPRSGFVWPIAIADTSATASSQQASQTTVGASQTLVESVEAETQLTSTALARRKRIEGHRKKDVVEPLSTAIQTTTLHLRALQAAMPAPSNPTQQPEPGPPAPTETTNKRATPVLLSTSPTAPGQPGPKGPPGGGKKKKKRTSVALSAM